MEGKAIKYSFQGMNRDLSESKHPVEFFYEANNIRFLTTDDVITGGIAFEKGNELKVTLPSIIINPGKSTITTSTNQIINYKAGNEIDVAFKDENSSSVMSGLQVIIGHTSTRDSLILFSTDENNMDCVWEVNMNSYDIKLLYLRNLGLSQDYPIQAVYNYENENIQKVYWVDGINQIRFINIKHSIDNGALEELINVNSNTINFVGNFKVAQPVITQVVSGGNHTSGMIQYAYNLYRLNSSQTKLSPTSELISLNKGPGLGGGKVNEIVGGTPVVEISNLDPEYTHIKVYAIKYTSYNQTPSISLIEDQEIPTSRKVTIFDDGNIKEQMSLEQLLFLGSDPIIPKHIETKDNIMFYANIKEKVFDVELDTRAYSFNNKSTPEARIHDEVTLQNLATPNVGGIVLKNGNYTVYPKHDAVNLNYDDNKYQADGATLGGEGKYIKYEIIQDTTIQDPENYKFYKDNEVYRFGIQFFNGLGQTSLPKWVADYRMPEGNLEGKYNTVKFTLKPEFYVWLNTSSNFASEDDKPVGYKVLRANRTLNDQTILAQGFLNGMMSNYKTKERPGEFSSKAISLADKGDIMPSLQRPFGEHYAQLRAAKDYGDLSKINPRKGESIYSIFADDDGHREVHWAKSSEHAFARTWQYNKILQFFSPEITFGNVSSYNDLTLHVKGALKNKTDNFWGQERQTTTKEIRLEGKIKNGLTARDSNARDETQIIGDITQLCDRGVFGPNSRHEGSEDEMDFLQFYRNYTGGFIKNKAVSEQILGKPQIIERGQGKTEYNGDNSIAFYNSLQPMGVDGGDGRDYDGPPLTSVNSFGARCMTMLLGNPEKDFKDRTTLEALWKKTGITESNVMLVAELRKNDVQVYLGGIYGGNSFEDKKRTKYIEIGIYNSIETTSTVIKNGGDTFVQNFRFAKLAKTDTEVYSGSSLQITEIVEGRVESSIDLKNRHDLSLIGWDSRFQPRYDDYHQYNKVYSQQSTLKQESDLDYNFRRIKNFDTRVMASKVKIPGEFIDSWTDVLVNEMLDLNGKHGRINALVSFKDNLYAFQDNAFAILGINPRVQVQGGDGLAIELGTGGILHDYNYISTTSGSINKWGVISTSNGVYYLDALNKAILRFTGESLEGLSATRGLHKYLVDNLDIGKLKTDNPLISEGVSMGYDLLNSDVYITHNNGEKIWTLCFNEKIGQFTGFYDYHAPMYVYTKEKLLTLNPNAMGDLYETHAGEYNIFYGENKASSIIFIANPEPDHECIFSNLEYKSVALDANKQEQRYTWEQVRLYNEFQDSGLRALDMNSNIRKLNRKYRVALPRNKNSTDRIRNNWAFIELRGNNLQKLFYLNQDIILHYRPNYIMIR